MNYIFGSSAGDRQQPKLGTVTESFAEFADFSFLISVVDKTAAAACPVNGGCLRSSEWQAIAISHDVSR